MPFWRHANFRINAYSKMLQFSLFSNRRLSSREYGMLLLLLTNFHQTYIFSKNLIILKLIQFSFRIFAVSGNRVYGNLLNYVDLDSLLRSECQSGNTESTVCLNWTELQKTPMSVHDFQRTVCFSPLGKDQIRLCF